MSLCAHSCPIVSTIQAFLCDWGNQEWRTNNKLTIENGKPTMEDHIVNDKLTIENGKPTMEDHIVNDKLTIENGKANNGRSLSE